MVERFQEANMSLFRGLARSFTALGAMSASFTIACSGVVVATSLAPTPAHAQSECTTVLAPGANGQLEVYPDCPYPGQTVPVAPTYFDKFTAIAISGSTLASGSSWQANSRTEAEQIALAQCSRRARDCKIATWGEDVCLALATSAADGSWGVDYDTNGARAKARAMSLCGQYGGKSCRVVTDPCAHD